MTKPFSTFALAIALMVLTACGDQESTGADAKDPKDAMIYQFELLKAGDLEKFKRCFTERVKGKVTAEDFEAGRKQSGRIKMEDLVGSVEYGEFEGKKTAKIKMTNGHTVTTLIQVDGKWLADTLWFQ